MGWFDEQIKQRKQNDQDVFTDAFINIAGAVMGAMLGIRKSDGMVVALIPTGFSGYSYRDMETGKLVKINGKNQDLFEEGAIAFYKPLAVTLIGMLSPKPFIPITEWFRGHLSRLRESR